MMSTAGALFHFATRSPVRKYGPRDEAVFCSAIKSLDAATTCRPITSPDLLKLNANGATNAGYRFTSAGFAQVASKLAKGLSRLLPDLANGQGDRARFADGGLARRLWNDTVELRLGALSCYRVILNDRDKTIDGLNGDKSPFIDNTAFLEQARAALSTADVVFHAAIVAGRRMAVWLRSPTPLLHFTFDGRLTPIYRGFYFGNGEAAGTAARITNSLFTPWGVCLLPYRGYGKKMRRLGHKFLSRFAGCAMAAASHTLSPEELTEQFTRMATKSVGFPSASASTFSRYSRKLVRGLFLLDVPQHLARLVVAETAAFGLNADGLDYPQPALAQTRRQIDLFACLLRAARKLDLDRRELLEQAAFAVLQGKVDTAKEAPKNAKTVTQDSGGTSGGE